MFFFPSQEVDMCVTTSAPSSAKLLVSDISYPVLFVDAAILIPFPKEKTKWVDASAFQSQANIKLRKAYKTYDKLWFVFNFKAWLAIGCFFAFMILSAWIIHRLTKSNPDMECQNSLSFWIFYYFCIWMLIQGSPPFNFYFLLEFVNTAVI
jgi:hypothetical protein